jgi:quercetin dioxygenase-like cupin family protein
VDPGLSRTAIPVPSSSGKSIDGAHRFVPGDAVIIPAGVAHWFTTLDSTVDYLVVRMDPERKIPKNDP